MSISARSVPSPISVSTSQAWDSDGAGVWSTFVVQVGTPPSLSRVVISTAGDETWVVIPGGCPSTYGIACAYGRGGNITVENSTSWTSIGIYELDLELNLGYTGNGQYGLDVVSLGYPGSQGPTLPDQVVAGIATNDFWLGTFGIDPEPSNFTTFNDPQPSYLWTLANKSMIPSISWGYTAGAVYRYDKVQGSLTLGGYDASRFGSKNITYNFYQDIARRFVVQLTAITYIPAGISTSSSRTTLLSDAISIYIDSTIPYIYLPIDACKRFEDSFGIEWNDTSQIYTVNDTTHAQLLQLRPNITFTLTNATGHALYVTLPYSAFDLTASFPVVEENTKYFPLRRAYNDTQYTLGRVFLQEAYVIADYERSSFTISSCVWPSTFKEDLVGILPPEAPTIVSTEHRQVHVAAIVGGVLGGIILILVCLLVVYFFFWKPRHKKPNATDIHAGAAAGLSANDTISTKPELDAKDTEFKTIELTAMKEHQELAGTAVMEMDSDVPSWNELEVKEMFEMPAREPAGIELLSPNSPSEKGDFHRLGMIDDSSVKERKHDTYYNP